MKKKLLTALFGALLGGVVTLRADTTTPRMGLTEPAIGSTNWGTKINNNYGILDSSVSCLGCSNTYTGINTFTGTSNLNGTTNINGSLALFSPLSTTYGGTGQNWSAITTGRIPYFTGTGALGTLAIGSSNQVLSVSGGIPTWGSVATSAIANGNLPVGVKFSTGNASATGTPSSTTFWRGDNTWATIATGLSTGTAMSGGNANSVVFLDSSSQTATSTKLQYENSVLTLAAAVSATTSTDVSPTYDAGDIQGEYVAFGFTDPQNIRVYANIGGSYSPVFQSPDFLDDGSFRTYYLTWSWAPVPGATSYRIFKRNPDNGFGDARDFNFYQDTTTTSLVDGNVPYGTVDSNWISGTEPSPGVNLAVAGTVQVGGFQMASGGADQAFLVSDSSGTGHWSTTPPDSIFLVDGSRPMTGSLTIGTNGQGAANARNLFLQSDQPFATSGGGIDSDLAINVAYGTSGMHLHNDYKDSGFVNHAGYFDIAKHSTLMGDSPTLRFDKDGIYFRNIANNANLMTYLPGNTGRMFDVSGGVRASSATLTTGVDNGVLYRDPTGRLNTDTTLLFDPTFANFYNLQLGSATASSAAFNLVTSTNTGNSPVINVAGGASSGPNITLWENPDISSPALQLYGPNVDDYPFSGTKAGDGVLIAGVGNPDIAAKLWLFSGTNHGAIISSSSVKVTDALEFPDGSKQTTAAVGGGQTFTTYSGPEISTTSSSCQIVIVATIPANTLNVDGKSIAFWTRSQADADLGDGGGEIDTFVNDGTTDLQVCGVLASETSECNVTMTRTSAGNQQQHLSKTGTDASGPSQIVVYQDQASTLDETVQWTVEVQICGDDTQSGHFFASDVRY